MSLLLLLLSCIPKDEVSLPSGLLKAKHYSWLEYTDAYNYISSDLVERNKWKIYNACIGLGFLSMEYLISIKLML